MKRKKTGGRRKGTPNKATAEAKEFCNSLVDDPRYQARLRLRLLAGKLPPAIESMLWHYAKGKPKEQIGIDGPQAVTIQWQDSSQNGDPAVQPPRR